MGTLGKKVGSRQPAATSKKIAINTGKIQKKDIKIREKRANWAKKISKLAEEKIEKEKEPLESFNILRRGLEDVDLEATSKIKQRPSAPETLKHVSTKRGRKNALKNEMEQFRQVLGHQMFRQNPLGVLETHLTNTVKLQQKEAASKL